MTALLWLLLWPAIAIPTGVLIGHLLRYNLEHPDPANTPGPGTSPVPGPPCPGAPQQEGAVSPVRHAPAPARLTGWERGLLIASHLGRTPQATANGREIADMARRTLPSLDDLTIGRVLLQAWYWGATFDLLMPREVAMDATLGAIAAAAHDLTEVERLEVPQ